MLENMREVHKVNCFRMELTFSDIQSTFLGGGIKKSAFCSRELIRSSLALLSVVSRCSLGVLRQGIRKGKETTILIKRTFSV